MKILMLFMVLMFIIYYKQFKESLQEIIIDLVHILLLPIKMIILIRWKLKKSKLSKIGKN